MTTTADPHISIRATAIQPSSTLAITARVRAMKADGRDIIGFGAGEPDFTTPDPVREAAIEAIRAGMTRYVPVPGIPEARNAVAEKFRTENSIDCEPDQIIISNGGKFSLYLAIQAIIDPGDEVIMPTPAWVSYKPMVELAGGTIVEIPTTAESGFLAAPEDFAAAITPRTRAVILNSPSNPCGTMYDPDAIRAICDVLSKHDRITLISDEIYERLVYRGREHLSPASLPSMSGKTITINGLSKAFAATGWRIGYTCAPLPIVKAMSKLQSQMTSSVTSFTLPALVTALQSCQNEVARMRAAFEKRAGLMERLVSVWPGVTCPPPMGAFYVFPDISVAFGRTSAGGRAVDDAGSFAEALLEETGVAVVPGDDFLGCGPNHVRLSFALDEASIEDGCSRTHKWLDALS
ncbi:MAG: pyridoxal phosphate-dependent aminotransferase [Planctomycetes bacterium]|nr:pyridoxal phosphate-dependent aminotransferase [Planctomycetota bacterium]MCP4838308.1 pyridoxal phosphate-dependent aminotransferase [Planctomycetota bacterium]